MRFSFPLISFLFLLSCASQPQSFESNGFFKQLKKHQSNFSEASIQSGGLESLCHKKHEASCLLTGKPVLFDPKLAIMQGPTSLKDAWFVIAHKNNQKLTVMAQDLKTKRIIEPLMKNKTSVVGTSSAVTHVKFSGLQKMSSYQLVVMNQKAELLDFRKFRTLNVRGHKLNFAVVSCMRDDYDNLHSIWQSLLKNKPQALFMIGDNAYLDLGLKDKIFGLNPETMGRRHLETRRRLPIYRARQLTPIFSIWDDHDYGGGDSDNKFPHKEISRKIFSLFFPMKLNHLVVQGPGLARAIRMSGQQFLFLDNRSFRTPKMKNGFGAHLGTEQLSWSLKKIKNFPGPSWLISGGQFFGAYHNFDSFESHHPKEFQKWLEGIKATRKKVVFVSGDRHMSEVMLIPKSRLGFESLEVTSSPMHSKVYPGASQRDKNPYRKVSTDGKWNFMIIKSMVSKKKWSLDIENRGEENQLYFQEKWFSFLGQ